MHQLDGSAGILSFGAFEVDLMDVLQTGEPEQD
jgi:hypothetical protein